MNTQAQERRESSEATRVLLVEDNPADARLLKEMLWQIPAFRFHVIWAERLSAALERLAEGGIDVVLLDLSLPDSRGLNALAKIQGKAPQLPILVLTGLDDEALAARAVREGAQDYLVKGQVDANLLSRAARYAIERKRAEEALRQSKQLLERALNSLRDAVFIIDANTVEIVDCNRAATEIFSYTRQQMVGRPTEMLHVDEGSLQDFRRHLYAAIEEKGFLDHLQFRMKRKDGTVFPSEHSVVPLEDDRGNRTGWVSVVRDITDRKRAEEERRRLQEQLAHAQKMEAVGTLAGGIAHEFNNINGDIIAYLDLSLEMEELPGSIRRNLETIRSLATGGVELTKSLLTFSRKDVGEMKPAALRDIVDRVLMIEGNQFAREGIEVAVEHGADVPMVMANTHMLESVVMNLFINARHAMLKSATKNLTVQTGTERGRPFIRVNDTGCGIPKEDLPRVFEPFFTTKGALATGEVYDGKAHGTGLGLSLCHTIVEGHGGEITVSSEVGKGTSFVVYLTAAPERRGDHPAHEGRNKQASRMMVVDDDEGVADTVVDVLAAAGYSADGFTNPMEALGALRGAEYALAFVDLHMPEMRGQDFIEMVSTLPPETRPLMVILSGRPPAPEKGFDRLGVFATLTKPFTPEQVLDIVEEGLGRKILPAARAIPQA
jgi:PAS domain S-box-containing protein